MAACSICLQLHASTAEFPGSQNYKTLQRTLRIWTQTSPRPPPSQRSLSSTKLTGCETPAPIAARLDSPCPTRAPLSMLRGIRLAIPTCPLAWMRHHPSSTTHLRTKVGTINCARARPTTYDYSLQRQVEPARTAHGSSAWCDL